MIGEKKSIVAGAESDIELMSPRIEMDSVLVGNASKLTTELIKHTLLEKPRTPGLLDPAG